MVDHQEFFQGPRKVLVTMVAMTSLTLTLGGCGSSGPAASSGTMRSSSAGSGTTDSSSAGSGTTETSAPSGKSVSVTMGGGYQFGVSLVSPGVTTASTFTTNDSSGSGGTPIDAPPGQVLVLATLRFVNNSDRQEPLVAAGDGRLPSPDAPSVHLFVPQSDASAFGLTTPGGQTYGCGSGEPSGYCSLGVQLVGFSPAQTDITAPPELAPGASGTVTVLPWILSANAWVPQAAPVRDVKVEVETTGNCMAALSIPPGCLVALN